LIATADGGLDPFSAPWHSLRHEQLHSHSSAALVVARVTGRPTSRIAITVIDIEAATGSGRPLFLSENGIW